MSRRAKPRISFLFPFLAFALGGCFSRAHPGAMKNIVPLAPSQEISGAVSVTKRVENFSSVGLSISTITRTSQGDYVRVEIQSDMGGVESRTVTIVRPDLGKEWRLDDENMRYMESPLSSKRVPIPPKSVSKSTETRPSVSQVECVVTSTKTDLEEGDLFNGLSTNTHKFFMEMPCVDKKAGKEVRRHLYREQVYLADHWPSLEKSRDLIFSNPVLIEDDILPPVSFYLGFIQALFGRDDLVKESARLMEERANLSNFLMGKIPVLRVQSSSMIEWGEEISFDKQYAAVSRQKGSSGFSGLPMPTDFPTVIAVAGVAAVSALANTGKRHEPPVIPAWVLEIDPDFAKHGGMAQRVQYLDMRQGAPAGSFDIPPGYRKVKSLR
jgi:hypothetical protein